MLYVDLEELRLFSHVLIQKVMVRVKKNMTALNDETIS